MLECNLVSPQGRSSGTYFTAYHQLKILKGQVIGAVEELCDNSSKAAYTHKIEELEKCALVDPHTGLMKKRGLR